MHIPKHHTLVAYAALFAALGGTSVAATNALSAGSVGTRAIKNGAVTKAKLAKGAQPLTGHAFDAAVADTMTSDQVLTALAGAVQGAPGLQGQQGAVGPQGDPGKNGANGSDGAQGQQGVQGAKGDNGSQGPAGTVAGGEVAADGSTDPTNTPHISVTRTLTPTVGTYCVDSDHNIMPNPHGAVVTPEGNGSSQLSAQVQRNPSGVCAGHDFAVITMNGPTDTDEAFFVIVS